VTDLSKSYPSPSGQVVVLQRLSFAVQSGELLADEPTGNLDPATARNVLALLREVQHGGEQMVIVATHDPSIAAQADRQIRLGPADVASLRKGLRWCR
jgi:ABC-type lipoprotein export system ATPase subunit